MASKGGKRAAAVTAATVPSSKKPKVDPTFAGIVGVVQNAEQLPNACRQMLVAMVEPSLITPTSERHAVQKLGISMLEETLLVAKKRLTDAIQQARKELSDVESSRASRTAKVAEAQAIATDKKSEEQAKTVDLSQAEEAMREADNKLSQLKEAQVKGDEPLSKLREEKATLTALFDQHFKAPMDASEGPHYDFLQHHIEKLGLEESLAIALPSSCAKAKEQRGAFDDVVLGELGKAMTAKIDSLGKTIEEEAPAEAERAAAVSAAETSLETSAASAKAAKNELEAAKAAHAEAAELVSQAQAEEAALAPGIREATEKHDTLSLELHDFETGPLATFTTLRDKATLEQEAASAGA